MIDIKKTMEELEKGNRPFNKIENKLFKIIEKDISERFTKAQNIIYSLVERLNLSFDDFDDFENALAIMLEEIIIKIASKVGVQIVIWTKKIKL